jgi:hypothetical protein
VKAIKELVAKTGDLLSEEFLAGLLEFRNTPPPTRAVHHRHKFYSATNSAPSSRRIDHPTLPNGRTP